MIEFEGQGLQDRKRALRFRSVLGLLAPDTKEGSCLDSLESISVPFFLFPVDAMSLILALRFSFAR